MPTINKNSIREKPVKWKREVDNTRYYNTSAWENLREWYIKRHPFCEECEKEGRVTLAQHVHHITPFLRGETEEERWKLLLDSDNLESVCAECHSRIHQADRRGYMRRSPESYS